MSLALQRGPLFVEDFGVQAFWYVRQADEEVARRFYEAVETTLKQLVTQPGLGRVRRFRDPRLKGLRSFRVEPPFNKHLIFYRYDREFLQVVRLLHGARLLPRALLEPPGA